MGISCTAESDSNKWFHASGWLFFENELYRERDIRAVFEPVDFDDRAAVESRLRDCNGSFAIVIERSEETILATDHIQSVPLFYAVGDRDVYICDRLGELVENLGTEPSRDSIQFVELLAADMVLGRDTIYPDIYQVQPAEVVYVEESDARYTIDRARYRLYRDEPDEIGDEEAVMDAMDHALAGAIDRLVQVADGEPIILKLSAGYDSRLIALLLAQHGYDNFYTVHIERSSQRTDIVREISTDLDVPLTILSYSHEDVRAMYQSEQWNKLSNIVGRGATSHLTPSTATIHEAISECNELPDHGIIVDGGMAAAGTMVHPKLAHGTPSIDDVVDDILVKNFHNYDFDRSREPKLRERISTVIDADSDPGPDGAMRARERWYWQERANKRLASHPLMYSSWGYHSWKPLWDVAYMEVFNKMSLEHRLQKQLHTDYIEDRYRSHVGRFPEVNEAETVAEALFSRGKSLILDSPIERPVRVLYYPLSSKLNAKRAGEKYDNNPKFGFIPKEAFINEYTGSEHYRYFLNALEFGGTNA